VSKQALGTDAVEVIDERGTPLNVVVGSRGVYWLATPGPQLLFAAHGTVGAEVLARLVGDSEGPLALDSDALYLGSTERGRVVAIDLDTRDAKTLVSDLGTLGGIAVQGEWIYAAATSAGRILRIAKDGSANEASGPVAGPCPRPIGSAQQIASTPRKDANLEQLALHLDVSEVVATEQTYQRVVADIAAIRQRVPQLAEVQYFATDDGKSLSLTPTELTFQSIESGDYSAWDCLNEFYGLQSIQMQRFEFIGSSFVQLTLKGLYNLDRLATLYAQLPGISSEVPNRGGDASTICAIRNGSRYEYVVDRRGGDCPAGCTTHEASAFTSTTPGVVEPLGSWDSRANPTSPEWFARICRP